MNNGFKNGKEDNQDGKKYNPKPPLMKSLVSGTPRIDRYMADYKDGWRANNFNKNK